MKRVSFAGGGLFIATVLLAVVALCAALAGTTYAAHARAESARVAGALTVRVLSPATPRGVAVATATLRRAPGVIDATPMDAARAARLLDQIGGAPVNPAELPPLHLIEVRAAADADPRIDSYLRGAGVRAELYRAPGAASPGSDVAEAGVVFALAAVFLVTVLLFGAAALARGATAALGAQLGGARGDILALYGRSACAFAFLAGGAAAFVCTLGAPGVLMSAGEALSLERMAARISSTEAALVLLIPLLTAAAATVGARAGAARAFDRADRLA